MPKVYRMIGTIWGKQTKYRKARVRTDTGSHPCFILLLANVDELVGFQYAGSFKEILNTVDGLPANESFAVLVIKIMSGIV